MKLRFKPLLKAAALSIAVMSCAVAAPVFNAPSYAADLTFVNAPHDHSMGVAFDGSSYWSVSGGWDSGIRSAQYGLDGTLIGAYASGLDFRSVFTGTANEVLARTYSSNVIYKQTSQGMFSPYVTLEGASIDMQSAVVRDGGYYIAMSGGSVNRWDAAGKYIDSVSLAGYGAQADESSYPQNRGIAVAGDHWLTFSGSTVTAWSRSGARLDSANLEGLSPDFDSYFGFSYANGHVFVTQFGSNEWKGYAISTVPESGAAELFAAGLCGLVLTATWRRRRSAAQA